MRILIGILIGIALTRLYLNPLLQKNAMYVQKEKYLLNKLKTYCPESMDEAERVINNLQ